MKAKGEDGEARIERLLTRNVEDVIERPHLKAALRSGKKLRVKLGIDPTGAKIHIGRAVVLWKLREFQDLGHKVVLIIGDYTALIGDASDKLQKRPMLTAADIKKNLKTYLAQIGMIIDIKKAEVRYNSEWLSKLKFIETLRLTDLWSVQQMTERRNFKDRLERQEEIGLRELMYPLMQGYDSVAVKADVELGGTDQLFNVLAGRRVQEHYGQKPQDIMVTSMLLGTDGRKMSTSWGNVINIADAPEEQYGKVMASRDEMTIPYFRMATDATEDEILRYEAALQKGENPKHVKEALAKAIVIRYHGAKKAAAAAAQWENLFSKKEADLADIPPLKVSKDMALLDVVMASGIAKSKSDGRRLIEQGAVSIDDGVKKDALSTPLFRGGEVLKVGKKSFFRVEV